jgi:zinc transporter ZupT
MNDFFSKFGFKELVLAVTPLVLLAVLIGVFVELNPLRALTGNQPPVEQLSIERHVLRPNEIRLHVVNGGPEPVNVAQVQVDEAYWSFSMAPDRTVPRLGRATITIPYHWVHGELHEVRLVTSTGVTFDHTIEVATASPQPTSTYWWTLFWVGAFVGIVPVGLGLMWLPVLRTLGGKGMNFILALTVGLLVFLLVDTVLEGIEIAETIPDVFQAVPLVFFAGLLSFLVLVGISHMREKSEGSVRSAHLWLATAIAISIGLHNLGEGMAVGASIRLGEAALGSFLVIGFTLHNITEGIGIGAPIARDRPGLLRLMGLTLVAGGPAIIGVWVGSFAYSPLMAVIFLSIGAGAILQVVYEVSQLMITASKAEDESTVISWVNLTGVTAGLAIMYATALLVSF